MHPEHVCARLPGGEKLVGIAVARTGRGTTHVGIAFQWRDKQYLYHQAFHVDTKLEDFDAGTASYGGATVVVALPLRKDRQKAIAGFLDSLGKTNPQYPYSLKYDPKARIDRALGRLVLSDGKGVSCVTFVLAVFQTFQVRLVDATTWPTDRPEDLAAQQWLIDMIAKHPCASDEHKQAVRDEKSCTRVRPEEAGGSGYYKIWPVVFAQADPASQDVLSKIAALLPAPTPTQAKSPESGGPDTTATT